VIFSQKDIRLKLYPEMSLLKLTILGDHAFLRHYHTGLNVSSMPEYVFSHDGLHGGLYLPLYRYFLSRWNDPAIPEYALVTDDLVLRDQAGREIRRTPAAWLDPLQKQEPRIPIAASTMMNTGTPRS
jgi:hypothetical protein